jgi:hypothetical protein
MPHTSHPTKQPYKTTSQHTFLESALIRTHMQSGRLDPSEIAVHTSTSSAPLCLQQATTTRELCLGLARTVYIHRIWPYIWWFPCQKHRIYMVLANPIYVTPCTDKVYVKPWINSGQFSNSTKPFSTPLHLQAVTTTAKCFATTKTKAGAQFRTSCWRWMADYWEEAFHPSMSQLSSASAW